MHDNSMAGGASVPDASLEKALSLLELLKGSAEGEVYVAHLRELLLSRRARDSEADQSQLDVITQMVTILEKHLPHTPALDAHFRIIRLHLRPPVGTEDLALINTAVKAMMAEIGVNADSLRDMFKPLMQNAGARTTARAPVADSAPRTTTPPPPAAAHDDDFGFDPEGESAPPPNDDMRKIRDDFARQVDDAISHNEQFGVLLEVELDALQQAGKIDELEERRKVLVREVEKFVGRHRDLSHKFDTASRYLKIIESDNQQLNDELDRVRMLSLTDELTGLPNRRAFMKRLEDEVGRVNRYGYPISLVLIDLDEFKSINDIHGHAAGDAVLRCYAEYVLSAFRHHDMVARYGGEEFSVVLPNTREEGALRALAKAQDYAAQTYCMHNGERLNMPTFSAGLAEYRQGELPAEFIERADAALYRAKHSGRNRIEIASHEGGSAGTSSRQA